MVIPERILRPKYMALRNVEQRGSPRRSADCSVSGGSPVDCAQPPGAQVVRQLRGPCFNPRCSGTASSMRKKMWATKLVAKIGDAGAVDGE